MVITFDKCLINVIFYYYMLDYYPFISPNSSQSRREPCLLCHGGHQISPQLSPLPYFINIISLLTSFPLV